jgi:hypothetical protein
LSVQITDVSPSVSTEERRRTSALRRAIRWVASARESVTVGSSPSGNHDADGEHEPLLEAHPQRSGNDEEETAHRGREHRDEPCHVIELPLERGALPPHLLGERGDASELRPHPRRRHDRSADARRHVRASEHAPLRDDRPRLAGQHRVVDAQLGLGQQLRVRRDPVACAKQQQVAGNELLGRDLDLLSVTAHPGRLRQQALQRLRRSLRAVLLDEGEDRIDEDDDNDRRGQLRHPAHPRQRRPQPQEQGKQVDELDEEEADA